VGETCGIGKGGVKRGEQKRNGLRGKRCVGCWVLWSLCVLGCVSAVVVESAVLGIAEGWGYVQLAQ
jgi:hypothetical protein